jgi:hydrogenase-4 component B
MLTATATAIGLLLALGLTGPLSRRLGHAAAPIAYGGAFVACIALAAVGVVSLTGNGFVQARLPVGLPWIEARFRFDVLSGFFQVVVNSGGAMAALYGIGYARHEHAPARVLAFFGPFLAGMNLVLLADDAFTFLFSWEFMSLSSWLLVMAHHRDPENRRAGLVYLVMAAAGTFALLLAFGLLAGTAGGYAFDSIRSAAPAPAVAALVLVLALLGAGSKAGLVPLHVWLPLAHPAAPSHVSALMSGVMTKVAVYAFLRLVFDLITGPAWWWGLVVLALGALTTVTGVLHALMQRDLKRILAYSTVENIGVIFIGLGLALAFQAGGKAPAAALALTAALMHVLCHSQFKTLLFLGAGAVLQATGARDIDRLGGLIHRMPVTAALFLVGSAAISALPPLNGFVSEWLTFQAILLSPQLPEWGLRIAIPAAGAILALSAALAATCFVRAFGVAFLGRPRSAEAAAAREVDAWQRAAMGLLAFLCLAVGVLPGFFLDLLAPVPKLLTSARLEPQLLAPWLSLVPVAEGRSSYNGLLLALFIAFSAILPALLLRRVGATATRRAPAWDCGTPSSDPLTQYGGGSFAQPLRRVFGPIAFRARDRVDMPLPGAMRAATFTSELRDLAWDILYSPVVRAVGQVADRLNRLQFLTIRGYLTLVFTALVVLLLILAAWQ